MSKFISTALVALTIFSVAGNTTLGAESVSYPEKNPAFTVDVPTGWHAQFESGALKMGGNADALVMFQHVSDVKDDAAAKDGLPRLAEKAGETFNMQDASLAVKPTETEAGKFKTFMTAYKGKDKDNDDAFWYLAIFAPKKGDYYLMTVVHSLKDEKKTAEARAQIQTSIRPVDTASAKPKDAADSDPADGDGEDEDAPATKEKPDSGS